MYGKESIGKDIAFVRDTLREAERYEHALRLVIFDKETICPPQAVEEKGELAAFLEGKAFGIIKTDAFEAAVRRLYEALQRAEPDAAAQSGGTEGETGKDTDPGFPEGPARDMVRLWYRLITEDEKITPQMKEEFARVQGRAFADWLRAKENSDFSMFSDSLARVIDGSRRLAVLRGGEGKAPYDSMLDSDERGMSMEILDNLFGTCRDRLVPLLGRIMASRKVIRTDFLSRTVPLEAQRKMSSYLLGLLGYDSSRGVLAEAEHPFTDGISPHDVRVTTHYYPDCFSSNMFSVIHECGHALFELNQPAFNYDYFLTQGKTGGQHESVSRFYENIIGRSEAFTDLIYDKTRELFPEAMYDVSAREFYEGLNVVSPSLIRTEADELTYTLHIIIRYEIEKKIVDGSLGVAGIPEEWNRLYEEYLGIRPRNDREGVLQDVHWTDGFGYFPSYATGNIYNAMYYNRMKQDFDPMADIRGGDLSRIDSWMREHVYAKADRLAPAEWIRDITGRTLTPDDFLDYLEEKYGEIYGL